MKVEEDVCRRSRTYKVHLPLPFLGSLEEDAPARLGTESIQRNLELQEQAATQDSQGTAWTSGNERRSWKEEQHRLSLGEEAMWTAPWEGVWTGT